MKCCHFIPNNHMISRDTNPSELTAAFIEKHWKKSPTVRYYQHYHFSFLLKCSIHSNPRWFDFWLCIHILHRTILVYVCSVLSKMSNYLVLSWLYCCNILYSPSDIFRGKKSHFQFECQNKIKICSILK